MSVKGKNLVDFTRDHCNSIGPLVIDDIPHFQSHLTLGGDDR